MRTTHLLVAGGLLSLAAGAAVPAQDPVKAAPATHKVLLESDQARVLNVEPKAAQAAKK
jgi:hypothetical protein